MAGALRAADGGRVKAAAVVGVLVVGALYVVALATAMSVGMRVGKGQGR